MDHLMRLKGISSADSEGMEPPRSQKRG